jgi:hypothetical protein
MGLSALRTAFIAGPLFLVFSLGASGCSSDDATTPGGPRPEYEALFDPLPAATPDVLRGVWGVTQTSDTGSANLRFRFTDGKLVGGARCTFNQQGAAPLTTGQSTTLDVEGLDGKTGTFVPGGALAFQTAGSDPGLKTSCRGSLGLAEYTFEISGATMTLTTKQPVSTQILTKVGD